MNWLKRKSWIQVSFLVMSVILFAYFYVIGYTNTFSILRQDILWKERLLFPFYFTTITNLLICILFFFKIFGSQKVLQKQSFLLFEILVVLNAIITMIVYWALFARFSFPALISSRSYLNLVANFAVHLFIPLFAVANFFYELFVLKNKIKIKDNVYVFGLKAILFPICWLIIASTIYFSLGAEQEDAIYHFVHLIGNPIWITLLYFVIINSLYYLLALLFFFFNNHFVKEN